MRVLVVDDDDQGRDDLIGDLQDYNFDPAMVAGAYGQDIDRMIAEILEQQPKFVICDYKLQAAGMASFFGSAVVHKLFEQKVPAMLLTMYQSTDRLDLRALRHNIPVIMGRDEFRADRILDYFEICQREVAEAPVDSRKPHRVLIRIDDVRANETRMDAVIPSWSPDHAIPVPFACIDPKIIDQVKPGTYLLGDVNIGSDAEDELFFKNLDEIVPEPEEEK